MKKRPNILVFCTDQQRGDRLVCMGHPVLRTPNIDRLKALLSELARTEMPRCNLSQGKQEQ